MIYGLPTILAHGYLFTVASSDSVAIYNGDNGRLSSTISGQGYGLITRARSRSTVHISGQRIGVPKEIAGR